MMLLVVRHFQNGVDGFLLSAFNEAAGIDDDDLRFLRILCDLIFIFSIPSMISESTRFLSQPRLISPILYFPKSLFSPFPSYS